MNQRRGCQCTDGRARCLKFGGVMIDRLSLLTVAAVVRGNLPPIRIHTRRLLPMGTTRTTLPAAHGKVNGYEKLSKQPGIPRTTLQLYCFLPFSPLPPVRVVLYHAPRLVQLLSTFPFIGLNGTDLIKFRINSVSCLNVNSTLDVFHRLFRPTILQARGKSLYQSD